MKVLTLDPGLKNFAYCIAEVCPVAWKVPTIMGTGKFTTLIDKKDISSVGNFCSYIVKIMANFGLARGDVVFVERFANRGGFSGKNNTLNSEPINLMIGMVIQVASSLGVKIVLATASTWKRHCNDKALTVPKENRRTSKSQMRFACNKHERDTVGMLLYYWSKQVYPRKLSTRKDIPRSSQSY